MNIKALIYWIIVAIPLGWGLKLSIEKAKPLFAGALSAPAKPAAAPADAPKK